MDLKKWSFPFGGKKNKLQAKENSSQENTCFVVHDQRLYDLILVQ
jgi:hypothetical protein